MGVGLVKMALRGVVLAAAGALFSIAPARADVGVVLNDSVAHGVARITGAGHSGVYFSRICAASAVKLRLCADGEEGSVMSTYADFGEDQRYLWNAAPLSVYLYGVEQTQRRPLLASERVKAALEGEYQGAHLASECTAPACTESAKGQWRAMVGATQIRTVYVFVVSTTIEQDREFIEAFNQRPNEGRFNGFTRNCADFTREVINLYFPKTVRRNYLNDFGMSSPKSIARSFAKFAHGNADLEYYVMHFPQAPGTTNRSSTARAGTEQLVRSKKLLLPVLFFQAPAAGVSAVTYLFTGRFSAQRERERYPATGAGEADPEGILGSAAEWNRYRAEFAGLAADAQQTGLIDSRKDLRRTFKSLETQGRPVRDEEGRLWMEIHKGGETIRVGISAENVAGEESDPVLSYQLMLARVDQELTSKANARPGIEAFEQDWVLLQRARERAEAWQASAARK